MSEKPSIFISYSHDDEEEMQFVYRHLRPLERYGKLECWHDKKMSGGDNWQQKIEQQLDQCSIAIILISIDFLNSEFIQNHEVEQMLKRHARDELRIYPIRLRSCHFKTYSWLGQLNHRPACGTWLMEAEPPSIREPLMTAIVEEIDELLARKAEANLSAVGTISSNDLGNADPAFSLRDWGKPISKSPKRRQPMPTTISLPT